MKRKNVYNQGYFKPTEDQIEEKIFGKDIQFSKMAECSIMDLESQNVDFQTLAYLTNLKTVNILDENNIERTVLMLIFYDQSGNWFTSYQQYDPYFYVKCKQGFEHDVLSELEVRFTNEFSCLKIVEKVDLTEFNHLSGIKRQFIKLSFPTIQKMSIVRKLLSQKIQENKKKYRPKIHKEDQYIENKFELIENIFEYDLPYSARVCIDLNIRVSFWYDLVVRKKFVVKINRKDDLVEKPIFTVLAYDIETTKEPLKFPDPDIDQVILISYVIDEETFLIVNREICGKDVHPFDYNPKKGIKSKVTIFNEKDEKQSLIRFFDHIRISKPLIFTSFNGDFFDFPFIEKRTQKYGMDLEKEIGLYKAEGGKFLGKYFFIHLDCFYWVKRDSFLPHGSHGLKAVTLKKLGYQPIEVDPEDMVQMAYEDPQKLCEYSVSDAVATYYLYMQNIHDFIFALCTIIPMNPDDVLRRGSGTLCENLLMAKAFQHNIIFPNKQNQRGDRYYKNFLIENETYVGGFVECINNGIYRADIETQFQLDPNGYSELIEKVQDVIEFFVQTEKSENLENVENLHQIKSEIQNQLKNLMNSVIESKDHIINVKPLIYHVDVASMYPNIILTNRLQPTAIVNDKICSNCIFNEAKNNCKRPMDWDWKVTYYPIGQRMYEQLKIQSSPQDLKQQIKTHCQKNYKLIHKQVIEQKEDTVCMRENSFYVDTIRDFRDLRYKYKGLASYHYKKLKSEENSEIDHKMLGTYYDSLQLAHKIILNSFYGYVMKKGARWYSMEMAAMVTKTGSRIIQESKNLLDRVGKPLELDTDGIWTLLPQNFPENFELKIKDKKPLFFSFTCSLMNWLIYDKFKNPQYQILQNKEKKIYKNQTEMSIFFEIDGPYKAIIIPAAREENKKLKKRYCVFNFENKITEIKGFEIKRRGELQIVKIFQSEIFGQFLKGHDLKSLYQECAQTAKKWLNIIIQKGKNIDDRKILELFGQLKVLQRHITDYTAQKSLAITAASRLLEIIGKNMDDTTGLNCNFIVSKKPDQAQLSARAVPTLVFQLEKNQQEFYLKKWLQVESQSDLSLKAIIDWDYYFERFVNIVQKIITIPAILQNVENPIPDIPCPDWLTKKIKKKKDPKKQIQITNMFQKIPRTLEEIENQGKINYYQNKEMEIEQENLQIERQQEIQQKHFKEIYLEIKDLRLATLKKKWIEERKNKKQDTLKQMQMQTTDIQAYAKELDNRVKKVKWNVLKISQYIDGYLKYWIIVDGSVMLTKQIEALRKIFVNSYNEIDQQIAQKILPRDKQTFYLYEFQIKDSDFQETMNQMNQYLTDPKIEGVYETQIDMDFRAIVQSGNICKIQKTLKENTFNLDNLQILDQNASLNFQKGIFNKKIKVIYCWTLKILNKQMAMIFTEENLYIIKLFKKEKETQEVKLQIRNYVKENLNSIINDDMNINIDLINIHYEHVNTFQDFLSQINKSTQNERENHPLLIVVDSNNKKLKNSLKNLQQKYPVLFLQFEIQQDKKKEFSSLDWYLKTIQLGIQYFKKIPKKIAKFEALSQFAKIPIGNLMENYQLSLIRTIDILFARQLNDQGCVWWFSKNNYPDLGTKQICEIEDDDIFSAEQLKCQISRSFIADHYVIEIDIQNFQFNVLIQTELNAPINDMQIRKKKSNKKQTQFSVNNEKGFKIIKQLFLYWYQEYHTNDNQVAGQLIKNLVRWMCDENSYFYDPYFKQTLDQKTKIIFNEFIHDLEELGVKIIFASTNKIIVSTKKVQFYSANTFIQFVLNSIVKMQKYSFLQLSIVRVFKILVFKNIHNFGGVTINLETLPDKEEIEEKEVREYLIYFSKWKLKEIFPIPLQMYFDKILKIQVEQFYEIERQAFEKFDYEISKHKEFFMTKFEDYISGSFIQDMNDLLKFIQQQVRNFDYKKFQQQKELNDQNLKIGLPSQYGITQQEDYNNEDYEMDSFIVEDGEDIDGGEIVREVQNNYKNKDFEEEELQDEYQENKYEWNLPEVCGMKFQIEKLPLEFLKVIFEILTNKNHQAQQIFIQAKKFLLKEININYYGEESKFQEIFYHFELYDVICKKCFMVMDLDIFLDLGMDNKYRCQCNTPYDHYQIENKIIQMIKDCQKKLNYPRYYCKNCRSIKEDCFFERCLCGGEFQQEKIPLMKEFNQEKMNNFKNFKQLAFQCEFLYLQDFLLSLQQYN